jgi:methyl-accepting chemotaxis protein
VGCRHQVGDEEDDERKEEMRRLPWEKWGTIAGLIVTIALIVAAHFTGISSAVEESKTYTDRQIEDRKTAETKFATKEETAYIKEALVDLKSGIDLANDRLYEIQQNQVLVRVANDRLVKIQKRLTMANENVSDLKDEMKKITEKKKGNGR